MPQLTDRAPAVTVTIARDPALVRTVRLVAASVARRTGRDEEFVEEVRLAAGEACALFLGEDVSAAADLHRPPSGTSEGEPVEVTLRLGDALTVEVSTAAPVDVHDHPDSDLDGIEPWALLRGLVDDFGVEQAAGRTTVTMRWSLAAA
jgi:hypothetical protein